LKTGAPSAKSWWFPMRPEDLQRLVDASPVHRGLRLRVLAAGQTAVGETLAGETVVGETVVGETATGLAVAGQVWVRFAAQTGPEHAGEEGSGYLHGGVVATLLDTAATFALIRATGVDWGTVDLRVDFVRPAPVGALLVGATVVHAGRRLGRANADLTDPSTDRLLASAAGTFARTVPAPASE
jgi:uncharacterized protein (TIGR00369 family)